MSFAARARAAPRFAAGPRLKNAGVLRCDVPADANATLVSLGGLGHGIARDERAAQLAAEAEASR